MTAYYLEPTDVDQRCWVRLPTEWPIPDFEEEFPDPEAWSRAAAGATWEDSGQAPGPQDVEALAATLAYCARVLPDRMPGFDVFLYLPSPRLSPQPVYLGDIPVDGAREADAAFRTALGADRPGSLEAPLVEDFTVPTLGTGKRSLRYAKADDGSVIASLRYAWYVEEHGFVATARAASGDPAGIVALTDDLDRLCRGLRYLPEDAFPG